MTEPTGFDKDNTNWFVDFFSYNDRSTIPSDAFCKGSIHIDTSMLFCGYYASLNLNKEIETQGGLVKNLEFNLALDHAVSNTTRTNMTLKLFFKTQEA